MKKILLFLIIFTIGYAIWTYLIVVGEVSAETTGPKIVENVIASVQSGSQESVDTAIHEQEVSTDALSALQEITYDFEDVYGSRSEFQGELHSDMVYVNSFTELPLYYQDYYWGKYENAAAGADGLNRMPILNAGDEIGVVTDKYINIKSYNGYIQPAYGYYFASGVCWSTTTLGTLMNNANADFQAKYGMDLFVFEYGDRSPHSDWYQTYQPANNGYGYSVYQISEGVPGLEYRFKVNPEIANVPELADLEVKVVMMYSDTHDTAAYGQSIAGFIASNKEF
ncbi:hypothetical protein KC909_01635 [Candidatus Dojkabacteria bacterium]|uniref:Uncharacterized protein n=1 Tax=Candidatus Dojkabacteria bacterium TaxID=2099670 RepID=A0A955L5J5_9BACT|nr:hypothetical protein [Candidatus Dojkabacteria bacterium]